MPGGYRIRNLTLHSGERFPVLTSRLTGHPLFSPTLFVLNEMRSLGRASQTLLQATRSVKVGLQILEHLEVDLSARFADGRVMELGEIESLVRKCWLRQESIDQLLPLSQSLVSGGPKVVSLEKARMRALPADDELLVDSDTVGIRLLYIRNYIAWLARGKLLSLSHKHPSHQALLASSQLVIDALSQRIPSDSGRNALGRRQAMTKEEVVRMLDVIDPASPENPWKNHHVRVRNQLIFLWLHYLGLRKGELLILRLSDINLKSNEVLIPRRADDKLETRKDPPNTKTKDRLLALDSSLAELTRAYILGARRDVSKAKRHPYFLVATGTGKPLTKSAVNKLFVELRTKVPGLPEELSPHVLRHNWNENFSDLMDDNNVEPAEEERMRKQQMGWSDNSSMGGVYTRRRTVKKTNEASIALQQRIHARRLAKKEDKT